MNKRAGRPFYRNEILQPSPGKTPLTVDHDRDGFRMTIGLVLIEIAAPIAAELDLFDIGIGLRWVRNDAP